MKNRILIVGPAWVGDMVMAQCLFKLLKERRSTCMIDVLAPAWSASLLASMPEVSSIIVSPIDHGQLALCERYALGKRLRAKRYEQAIVLPNSFKSALIPFFANIPLRTGWRGEMRYGVLNDLRVLDEKRYPLMIERFMALGLKPSEVLPNPYPLPELEQSSQKNTSSPILALCPGAEFGSSKRWPEEYYAEIANTKWLEGWEIWILGSSKDKPIAERIMTLTSQRCRNFSGKTSLEEAVKLLSMTTLVVSNDSGLMHIAAALKKPLVVIYGSTSARLTPPLEPRAKILTLQLNCQPCFKRQCPLKHHHCMRHLKPHSVLQAMQELIA